MKKLTFLFAALLVMAVGCNKEMNPQKGDAPEEQVFLSFKIAMPDVKSSTDSDADDSYGSSDANPDIEVGTSDENTVKSIDIILADENGEKKAEALNITQVQGVTTETYVASFNRKDVFEAEDYRVYIYVNGDLEYSQDAVYTIASDNLESNIAKKDEFLMTNADDDNLITMPADMKQFTVASNPFNIGTFNVERAVARFDYKAEKTDNIYTWESVTAAGAKASEIQVQLTDIALMNLSKSFYHFRRTSADGTATGWTVGGTETKTNYVVDTDWEAKANHANYDFSNNYLYYMTESEWTALADITVDDNWTPAEGTVTDGYKKWRYVIENTIPSDGDDSDGNSNQINGLTTGVKFKGELQPSAAATDALKDAMEEGKQLFVFQNVMYGSWEMLENAANAEGSTEYALQAALANLSKAAGETEPTAEQLAAAGFKGFSANADGKYEVIYTYWNRHNDNGDVATMGPMEFSVVRNNVYKLSVTKIGGFGSPADPEDPNPDPDPDPDTPDEDLNYYFQVAVKVLPWVVRVNNIEF